MYERLLRPLWWCWSTGLVRAIRRETTSLFSLRRGIRARRQSNANDTCNGHGSAIVRVEATRPVSTDDAPDVACVNADVSAPAYGRSHTKRRDPCALCGCVPFQFGYYVDDSAVCVNCWLREYSAYLYAAHTRPIDDRQDTDNGRGGQ